MGLLDSVSGMLGETGEAASGGGLESTVSGLLGKGAGELPGLLDKFKAGGMGDVAQSWVGKGANLPINADQVRAVLGSDAVASVAGKLGISQEAAAAKIAEILPSVIDKLTPDGMVPDPEALAAKLTGFIDK